MNRMHDHIVNKFFKDKTTNYSIKLYNELKDIYNIEVIFESRMPSEKEFEIKPFSPYLANASYKNGQWSVKIFNVAHSDVGRIISHELLHILLRYRKKLPFVEDGMFNYIQGIVIDQMDYKLIIPELNRFYGKRKKELKEETKKIVQAINPYLDEINEDISRDKYIEILEKCLKSLNEKMPRLIL